jgi:glycosyltransferase involved in cell wall biosynthesis
MFGLRSYLVPMGYDETLFTPCEKSREEFRVVFTGSLYHKGVDIASKLAYILARKYPDMRFVFLNGAKKSYMDSALEYKEYLSKSLAGKVATLSELEQGEFAQLLGQAHLLMFPSKWESFGRVVIEALGAGCPVACFDIAGPPCSLIRDSRVGYVARPFDAIDLAGGIITFYNLWKNRFDDYLQVSRRCRDVSLKYSWKELAVKYFEMFRSVDALDGPRA